ncbi:glycogen synthase GlgA [Acetobacterium paludosum]|uniref:glycogen synthase GlgA n=1 Tax=Acetobacterium paludosum TaxID=52693 RepID=UPI00197AFF9E|nr:glycogen synthase GlgA [Acetobacterium paludosum]
MLNVLFVASEAYPFAKSGGLGDVIGALPKSFAEDVDVRVILPFYSTIPEELKRNIKSLDHFHIRMNNTLYYCGILSCEYEGITFYFIDNESFFKRPCLYNYFDDGERFLYFCRAVLDSIPSLNFDPDIIHCNDWQTAAIPYLLKHQYRTTFPNTKSVFTIHNLKYQGIYGFNDICGYLHLGFLPSDLEYYGKINLLKGALYSADLITTVSPTYAQEIKDPFYGEGLERVIQHVGDHVVGILNGIDEALYDPKTDPALFIPYANPKKKKSENKKALQEYLDLPIREDVPMVSMITRLVEQKGLDLVANVIHEILQLDLQLVILGTGEPNYENLLRSIAYNYPDKMITIIDFDEPLSRKIYAASDFFLMPSKFEPCGLSQMIAMRYGAVPIVRETGGLKDTVTYFNSITKEGNGFSFATYNAHDMLFTIQKSIAIYHNEPETFNLIVNNAFNSHFDWKKSAQIYLSYYKILKEV